MLSVFPDLLAFWIVAPLVLRITLGLVFLHSADWHLRKNRRRDGLSLWWFWYLGVVEIIIAGLLIAGFLTQIAALAGLVAAVKFAFFKKSRLKALVPYGRLSYLLLAVIALSLLVLGPGIFAIDLPL